MFQPEPGATLLFPSGPAHDPRQNHLFVVMTGPCGPGRQVLMVPISTLRKHSDQTCVLEPGAHEFVERESVVEYRHARIERADNLDTGVESGEFIEKPSINEKLLGRIRDGFRHSRFVKPFAREFLEDYLSRPAE